MGTFVKRDPAAPVGFFSAEARGLHWLGEVERGVRVVAVRAVGEHQIELDRLEHAPATLSAAADFGRRLARTHRAGARVWGRDDGDGFIGPLPLPHGPFADLADLWWSGRVAPFFARCVQRGLLHRAEQDAADRAVHSALAQVPAEAPSRLHGDLWSGNVVWTPDGAVLIDAGAAHGGHREADLAMLALFGLPHLDVVLASYDEEWPLAAGWQNRVPLWQLHPLLVHVVLFGGAYVDRTRQVLARLAR